MEKTVLLMFLGGVPNSPNIISHWLNMNTRFDNKDNVYVVVHPVSLPYEINAGFSSIFKPENIYVVNESHHVPTMWGTLSLVDAELLMMQYGHRMRKNALGKVDDSMYYYDKYILLSNTCCPLYTLDVIYSDVLSDEKSIIGAFPYTKPSSQSQWMVLDKQHTRLFFTSSTDTYEKTEVKELCQTTNVPKFLYRLNVKSHDSRYSYFYNEKQICKPADELFFIEYMINVWDYTADDITEHLRILTNEQVIRHIKSVPIAIYAALKDITDSNKEQITHLDPIFLGDVPMHIQKGYLDTQILAHNDTTFVYSTSVLGSSISTEYNPSNVLRDFNAFELNVNEFINMDGSPHEILAYVSNKVTDCDELRARLNISVSSDVFSIRERPILTTINHPIEYSSYTLRTIMNTFILLYKISCLFNNSVLYYGWNTSYVNAIRVIMMVYLTIISKEFGICGIFNDLVELNSNIIKQNAFKELMGKMSSDDPDEANDTFLTILNTKYLEMSKMSSIKHVLNKKFGTCITHDALLSAICNQSYFIRKCYDSSRIETFSDVLKTIPMITLLPEPRDQHTLELVTPQRININGMHFNYTCGRKRINTKKNRKRRLRKIKSRTLKKH